MKNRKPKGGDKTRWLVEYLTRQWQVDEATAWTWIRQFSKRAGTSIKSSWSVGQIKRAQVNTCMENWSYFVTEILSHTPLPEKAKSESNDPIDGWVV